MDASKTQKPLDIFYNNLASVITIDSVVLFGSRANGKPHKDSDIDVIVVSDDFALMRSDKRLKLLDTAAQSITPEIQAWGFTTNEFKSAGRLSTLGMARERGIRYKQPSK